MTKIVKKSSVAGTLRCNTFHNLKLINKNVQSFMSARRDSGSPLCQLPRTSWHRSAASPPESRVSPKFEHLCPGFQSCSDHLISPLAGHSSCLRSLVSAKGIKKIILESLPNKQVVGSQFCLTDQQGNFLPCKGNTFSHCFN